MACIQAIRAARARRLGAVSSESALLPRTGFILLCPRTVLS
jgi:hypothetical protein